MQVPSNSFSLLLLAVKNEQGLWGRGSETFDFRLFSPKVYDKVQKYLPTRT